MSVRDDRQIADLAELFAGHLMTAVAQTVAEGSPEPSREEIGMLLAAAGDPEAVRSSELMLTLILIRWLSVARAALDDRPDRVDVALEWVEETLGKRYRSRARYTAPVLQEEEGATDILRYREALGPDFLPTLVWLLAGVVVRCAEGDVGWLARLVGVIWEAETTLQPEA